MAISEDDFMIVRCFALFGACLSFSRRSTTPKEIVDRAKALESYLISDDDEVMEES